MGCQKLNIDFFNALEVIHPKKRVSEEKKRINYYPFGLKHKGYNNTPIGVDHKYGYNGVEETDDLDFNMLEMDLRQYDPAIARWISIDPITHYSQSPYMAFNGNPVVFADPSGAAGECYTCFDSGSNGMQIQATGDFRKRGNTSTSLADGFEEENEKRERESKKNQGLKIGNLYLQRYPGKIDFVNTKSKEGKDKFLEEVIAWFGYVDQFGSGKIDPWSIINFNAELKTKRNIFKKASDWAKKMLQENDKVKVDLKDGNGNFVEIGYFKHMENNQYLYSGYALDFQGDETYVKGVKQNIYRINMISQKNSSVVIYMRFKGVNKEYFNSIRNRIKAYKPYKAKMIKKIKQ